MASPGFVSSHRIRRSCTAFSTASTRSGSNCWIFIRPSRPSTEATRGAGATMSEATLIALALVVFGWAVLAQRIEAVNVSGPLLLTAGGLLLGNSSWGIVTVEGQTSTVHLPAA